MGDPRVIVQEHGARVRIVNATPQRITLDRRTVAKINDNRPKQVVLRTDAPIIVTDRHTTVRTGGGMGLQGPRGLAGGSVPPFDFAFGDAPAVRWTAPVAGNFTTVRVDIDAAFNGAAPTIRVGTVTDRDALMLATENDPKSLGSYEQTIDVAVAQGAQLYLEISPDGSSAGSGVLYVTFVPSE